MIPYGRQHIDDDDIDAVVEILKSDYLTQGPKVGEFEKGLSEYCGAKGAVALNSATSALHVACLALGVGEGDLVWTSPITFVASANCALYCGADVDFVDVDSDTYNLSIAELSKKLKQAKANGRLPKVVIPVHLCGQSCDMEELHALSQEYGFHVIEDASHAVGGRYDGKPVGDCRYSDICVFSFHPVKIITTAEGGLALSNREELLSKMRLFASHGVTRDETLMSGESHGGWYYQQVALGCNYRMTEMQAALGVSQLKKLDQLVSRRNELADRYDQILRHLPIVLPKQSDNRMSSRHLYVIQVDSDKIERKAVFDALRERGVGVNVHYIPVYSQPYYQSLGFCAEDFPESENYYRRAISIPLYPQMTFEDQDYIATQLQEILS